MYVVKTTSRGYCRVFCAEIEQNDGRLLPRMLPNQNGMPMDNVYNGVLPVLVLSAKIRYIFIFQKGLIKGGVQYCFIYVKKEDE